VDRQGKGFYGRVSPGLKPWAVLLDHFMVDLLFAICYSRSARIDNSRSNQRIGKSDGKLDHGASRPLAVRSAAVEKEITY
jgi:hypothetical protein